VCASELCDHPLVYWESFWWFQLHLARLYSSFRRNPSVHHVINKYNIVFLDAKHASRYDAIVTRKLSAPRYLDRQMLETLHLYDDLRCLLGILGWKNFVQL